MLHCSRNLTLSPTRAGKEQQSCLAFSQIHLFLAPCSFVLTCTPPNPQAELPLFLAFSQELPLPGALASYLGFAFPSFESIAVQAKRVPGESSELLGEHIRRCFSKNTLISLITLKSDTLIVLDFCC